MSTYQCNSCNMGINDLSCSKCNTTLQHDIIEVNGDAVAVAKCPKGCGMIKSPQCCGRDMTPEKK